MVEEKRRSTSSRPTTSSIRSPTCRIERAGERERPQVVRRDRYAASARPVGGVSPRRQTENRLAGEAAAPLCGDDLVADLHPCVVWRAVQADAADDAPALPQRDARGLERQPNPSDGGNDIAHHTTVLARTDAAGLGGSRDGDRGARRPVVPSRDVKADLTFYRDILGGRVIFAIEAMGTRVAEIGVAPRVPRVVLADHLPREAPILLHRVSALAQTLAKFAARALQLQARVQLPL